MNIGLTEMQAVPDSQLMPIAKPDTLFDGLLIAIPVAISLFSYGLKELIQYRVQKKTEEYKAETERQKAEQQQKSDRIEYLEKQNEMLLAEILSLRRAMEMSGPMNLRMYNPSKRLEQP